MPVGPRARGAHAVGFVRPVGRETACALVHSLPIDILSAYRWDCVKLERSHVQRYSAAGRASGLAALTSLSARVGRSLNARKLSSILRGWIHAARRSSLRAPPTTVAAGCARCCCSRARPSVKAWRHICAPLGRRPPRKNARVGPAGGRHAQRGISRQVSSGAAVCFWSVRDPTGPSGAGVAH